MRQFVYPIVLYLDDQTNCYTVAFHDFDVYTEGDTVEEAFCKAKEFLEAYLGCSVKFNEEMEDATKYDQVVEKNPQNIVLLVDAMMD